jgi:tetratricopeptide (TPR) repeat protein
MSPTRASGFPISWRTAALVVLLAGAVCGDCGADEATAESTPDSTTAVESAPPEPDSSDMPASDPPSPGEPAGQGELDAAIDAKIGARSLNDYDRVLKHCKRALELGLDADAARFADDLYTGTLVDRAGLLVDVIYNSQPPNPQIRQMRALAMRDLEEIVTRDPNLGQAHLMIARLEALPFGDRERAAASARKALELLGDDRLQQARAELVLASVEDDPEAKSGHLDRAVELAPRDVDIRRTRGLFMMLQEEFGRAREDLTAAIGEEPEDASLHEALGMACLMDDRPEEAAAALDRAVELAPDSPGPYLQRARMKASTDNLPEAIADLDRALDIVPSDPSILVLRSSYRYQAGDAARALEDVETVLSAHPGHPAALRLRGLMLAESGDFDASIRDFRRLAARNPADAELESQLGMLYLLAKRPREAIRRFSRALEIDERHFPSCRGIADARISIGDHEGAVADLERARTLRPEDSGVLNNLAWLLATSPEQTIRDGGRAIELATQACEKTEWSEAHIISTLAAGYAEKGDFEAARRFSRQAVEMTDAEDEVREQLEGELASYERGEPWRERQEVEEAPPADDGLADIDFGALEEAAARAEQPPVGRRPFDDD